MVFGHRDHRQQSYDTKNDTYFFSFSYFLQPTVDRAYYNPVFTMGYLLGKNRA